MHLDFQESHQVTEECKGQESRNRFGSLLAFKECEVNATGDARDKAYERSLFSDSLIQISYVRGGVGDQTSVATALSIHERDPMSQSIA